MRGRLISWILSLVGKIAVGYDRAVDCLVGTLALSESNPASCEWNGWTRNSPNSRIFEGGNKCGQSTTLKEQALRLLLQREDVSGEIGGFNDFAADFIPPDVHSMDESNPN